MSINPQKVAICMVIAVSEDGDEYAVFSDLKAGQDWAESRTEACIVIYPMIVDEPDYGDTRQH